MKRETNLSCLALTVFCLLFSIPMLIAQEFNLPDLITLESEADYKDYEDEIIQAIDWLQNTAIDVDPEKRTDLNGFIVQWLTGCPYITIEIFDGLVPLDSPETMMAILGGYTKYSLQNNYSSDKKLCAIAGINAGIDFYKANNTNSVLRFHFSFKNYQIKYKAENARIALAIVSISNEVVAFINLKICEILKQNWYKSLMTKSDFMKDMKKKAKQGKLEEYVTDKINQ